MAYGVDIDLLNDCAIERFTVGDSLTRYDSETARRIAFSQARGDYQRAIAAGVVTAGYAGGGYQTRFESYIERLRGVGLDAVQVVSKGCLYLLIGERQTVAVARVSDGVIPCKEGAKKKAKAA